MTANDIYESDVAAIEPDMPVTFVFQGRSYVGQKNVQATALLWQDAGGIQSDRFMLDVRLSVFGVNPAMISKSVFQISSVNYSVKDAQYSPEGRMVTYTVEATR